MKINQKTIKEQEAYFQFELYRGLKDFVLYSQGYYIYTLSPYIPLQLDFKWEGVFDILPEVPVKGDWIDLLVTVNGEPFLVIETKKRFKFESRSIALAVVKTRIYAKNIGAPFYMVCNDSVSFIFNLHRNPYLLGVFSARPSKVDYANYAELLLYGLVKFQNNYNMDILLKLPSVPDKFDVEKKFVPSILQEFSKVEKSITSNSLTTWLEKIH